MSLAVSAMFNVSFKNDLDKRALICPSVRVTKILAGKRWRDILLY